MKPQKAVFQILSPFDNLAETEILIEAGATELYGGVSPDGWRGRGVSANQRTFDSAQFSSEEEFRRAVEAAGKVGAPVYLTLNAPVNSPAFTDDLLALAERAAGFGVRGAIVGDPALIVKMKEAGIKLQITLSTMAGAMNRHAFGFFASLGPKRAVLPRHLTISESAEIAAAFPEIGFEAFVMVGKCPNEEAHCSFQHTAPDKRWPCEIEQVAQGPPTPLRRRFSRWSGCDRRAACGLCALQALLKANIRILKLVGRGGPTAGKVANVKLVKKFAENPALGRKEALLAYEERFGRPCDPLICYYPELHPEFSP